MLQMLETGETNSVTEHLHSVLLRYSGSVSCGFSALVMQFVTVRGGGRCDSEPESSIKLCWSMVVAVVGCGVRRGVNEAALW